MSLINPDYLIATLQNQLAERDKRIAELEKDAKRYQWFAGNIDGDDQDELIRLLSGVILIKSEIDNLIDAALQNSEKQS